MILTKVYKGLLFEYMIIRLANWYSKLNNYTSLREFNDYNDFGWVKSLLFPFFICTANGKRELLFSSFDHFRPEKEGLVEHDIFNMVHLSKLFRTGVRRTIIKEEIINISIDFLEIESNLSNMLFEKYQGLIRQEDKAGLIELISAISESINHIRLQEKFASFPKFTEKNLSLLSTTHNSWEVFPKDFKLLPEEKITVNVDGTSIEESRFRIPPAYLINEQSIFASDKKHRVPEFAS